MLIVALAITAPRQALLSSLTAVIGSVIGSWILFAIGRKGGSAYLDRYLNQPRGEKLRLRFQRYGLVSVFVPAFIPFAPLPLKVFVLSSGAFGVSLYKFLGTIVLARLGRYLGLAVLALHLGSDTWRWLAEQKLELAIAAVTLLGVGWAIVHWWHSRTAAR